MSTEVSLFWNNIGNLTELDVPDLTQFLTFISCVENVPTKADEWVKWKSDNATQVVIRTSNYVYKFYSTVQGTTGEFECYIRNLLADIYKEYGLHWEIQTVTQGDKIYQFEQREILQVCTSDVMPFEEVLLGWKETLDLLEKRLHLSYLAQQVNDYITDNNLYFWRMRGIAPTKDTLHSIKLMRDCLNKFGDYAIKDNKIILLDDADWVLLLVNKEGEQLKLNFDNSSADIKIPVYGIIPGHEVNFVPNVLVKTKKEDSFSAQIRKANESFDKFTIQYNRKEFLHANPVDIQNARSIMLSDNLKLLSTGKPFGRSIEIQHTLDSISEQNSFQAIVYEDDDELDRNTGQLSLFNDNTWYKKEN